MKIEVNTEDNAKTSSATEDKYMKLVATHDFASYGRQARQTIDELGLVLLLVNVYGQQIIDVDWNTQRGDMFVFADNPIVRTCIGLWERSFVEDDILSPIERYLYSMLEHDTQEAFLEQEIMADERKRNLKEAKVKYGNIGLKHE